MGRDEDTLGSLVRWRHSMHMSGQPRRAEPFRMALIIVAHVDYLRFKGVGYHVIHINTKLPGTNSRIAMTLPDGFGHLLCMLET